MSNSDTMASAMAMASRSIVSLILRHLSDMKYKDRRQMGPDQPVEFLEFRPTLVPSILVNHLWADEGTALLWKRYPHLPALRAMDVLRRQWYANKVEVLFILGPMPEQDDDLTYLDHLDWPNLKSLEMEVDWERHGNSLQRMLHAGLDHLEFMGSQPANSKRTADTSLSELIRPCTSLQSISIGSDAIDSANPCHHEALVELLDAKPNITSIRIMNASLVGKDMLFSHFSQNPSLTTLEIDLEPGSQLLPLLTGSPGLLFPSLKNLRIMCYPDVALGLPRHLPLIEEFELDIARIPQQRSQESDRTIIDAVLETLTGCANLRLVKLNIGFLAIDFPSASSLPILTGTSLVNLAKSCRRLQHLTLLASEPAAIDASTITRAQFEEFCQQAPELRCLNVKSHPVTATGLEDSALLSLSKHCPLLSVLRIRLAAQLPQLSTSYKSLSNLNGSRNTSQLEMETDWKPINGYETGDNNYAEFEAFATHVPLPYQPLFPNLEHLAIARPQTVLLIAGSSYAALLVSQSTPFVDPTIQEDLARIWAEPLVLHFPRLEIFEAWGDWTGQDNDSLNYFLPLKEPLANVWEFLSGIEQDLWDDGVVDDGEYWDADFEEGISFASNSSGDWEKASLVNEFPTQDPVVSSGDTDGYQEELEETMTPGRTLDNKDYFAGTDRKPAPAIITV